MINKKTFTLIFIFFIFSIIFCSEPYFSKVKMIFTGDVMLHATFLKIYHGKKGFDFDPMFKDIKKELKGDLVFCNLETTLPGTELKYNGYPMFRSPDEILNSLKNAGFTHINFSNNHVFDSFKKGFIRTIKSVNKKGFNIIGARKERNEKRYKIISIKGIKFGIISYTYDTNIHIKNENNYINVIDKEKMKTDINSIKGQKPDFIITILHFGKEYNMFPENEKQNLAKYLFSLGVNFIIGMHPHTVQPYYFNGNYLHPKFIVFSLGNFIASQTLKHTNVGEMLVLNFEKDPEDAQLASYKIVYISKKKENGLYKIIKIKKPEFIKPKIKLY